MIHPASDDPSCGLYICKYWCCWRLIKPPESGCRRQPAQAYPWVMIHSVIHPENDDPSREWWSIQWVMIHPVSDDPSCGLYACHYDSITKQEESRCLISTQTYRMANLQRVVFDQKLHSTLTTAIKAATSVTIVNCQIKPKSQESNELEVFASNHSTVELSPRKFDITPTEVQSSSETEILTYQTKSRIKQFAHQ